MTSNANGALLSIINRIERLQAEKAALQADITEIFQEAKSAGFDAKIIRLLIKERKMDAADLQEQQALLETYRDAIGQLAGTPLGDAGTPR